MPIAAGFLAGPAARPVLMAGDVDTCSLEISVKHKKYRNFGRPPLTHFCRASSIVSYAFNDVAKLRGRSSLRLDGPSLLGPYQLANCFRLGQEEWPTGCWRQPDGLYGSFRYLSQLYDPPGRKVLALHLAARFLRALPISELRFG